MKRDPALDSGSPPQKPERQRRRPGPLRWFLRAWSVVGLFFTGWLFWNIRAQGLPPNVLVSDVRVEVKSDRSTLSFLPRTAARKTGLVFLPGAMVEPEAYAPLLRQVAERGHPAVLVRLPWRVAPLQSQREAVAASVRTAMASGNWVLAGHSRGAALAAKFCAEGKVVAGGLVLIGTTHPKDGSSDLSRSSLAVTKIFGSRDGVAPAGVVRANAPLLPPSTRWVEIEGGNHSQFGYYGHQLGDDGATVTRERQLEQTAAAVLRALERPTATHR